MVDTRGSPKSVRLREVTLKGVSRTRRKSRARLTEVVRFMGCPLSRLERFRSQDSLYLVCSMALLRDKNLIKVKSFRT